MCGAGRHRAIPHARGTAAGLTPLAPPRRARPISRVLHPTPMSRLLAPRLAAALVVTTASVATSLAAQAAPAQAPAVLSRGVAVDGRVGKADTARFTLTAADSTFVLGVVTQREAPVSVRLLGADGTARGTYAGPGTGDLRFSAIIGAAGTYRLEVTAAEGKPAAFTIRLDRQEPLARDPRRRTDQLLARYDAPGVPGAVIRVWRGGRVLYTRGYGAANLAYGIPYRPETPTNIGSTSKQFTAFAVLLQASRGKLSLDDDIRKHFPELPPLGDTVRVRHLLTHTSGLREFLNLLDMTDRNVGRDWIAREELFEIVRRQPKLQNAPGAEFNYNNTAFALAAILVERTSGKDFATFVRDEVFTPLGMTHSMVRTDRTVIVPGGAPGYEATAGGYRETGDLAGALGAGGIYTTVEDLQRWAENMQSAAPRVGTRAIFDQMMTDTRLTDGKMSGYGMGLFLDTQRGQRRVHHGGADIAHRSMLAMYPAIDAGVTVQSNDAGFGSNLAFELANLFFADAFRDSVRAVAAGGRYDPAAMTAERFAGLEGRYALDAAPAFVLRLFKDGAAFKVQATGQQAIPIVPTSDTTFDISGVAAQLRFTRGPDGRAQRMTLVQGGEQRATRVADTPPAAVARDLRAYEGRYESAELETAMTLVVRGDSLFVQQRRREEARLEPGAAADSFSGRDLTFTFERDRNGVVVAFYAANGRSRDVRFTRVGH